MVKRSGFGVRGSVFGVVALGIIALGLTGVTARGEAAARSKLPNTEHRTPNPVSWADSVLATLSPRDKAAQLVWPWIMADYNPSSSAAWRRIEDYINTEKVGGFIMSIGSPVETAVKINLMQQRATVPLVFSGDYETGAGFRARGGYFLPNNVYLGGATMLPYQMAMGAIGDSAMAYTYGRITALEGRAMGVHIAFAPVLDVNNNPANPVIGIRSFGENPETVARLGTAVARGIEDHGMLATGKHFPGHGDTEQNSHLETTEVNVSRARLDSVELVPFRRAIDAGIGAIMTFHGVIPALEPRPLPATLSRPIMTDLLRRQLGFNGLLVTDALDMAGVLARVAQEAGVPTQTIRSPYGTLVSPGLPEIVKRAIEAGSDVLLMPMDVPTAIDAVVAGVREGRFTQARVDSSVRRILELKQRFGLHENRFVDLEQLYAVVGDTSHRAFAQLAAQRSITLAKDSLNLVPLRPRTGAGARRYPVLSVTISRRVDLPAGAAFDAELRNAHPRMRSEIVYLDDPTPNVARLLALADSSDVVILSSHLGTGTNVADPRAPGRVVDMMRRMIARNPRTIVVALGNPYLLQQVPAASTYVVTYGGFPMSQTAAARAILGRERITATLPISIPPLLPYGAGIRR